MPWISAARGWWAIGEIKVEWTCGWEMIMAALAGEIARDDSIPSDESSATKKGRMAECRSNNDGKYNETQVDARCMCAEK